MSQEDRETLRLVYEAYNTGDWTGALSRMHRDIEWKTTRAGSIAAMTRSGGSWRTCASHSRR